MCQFFLPFSALSAYWRQNILCAVEWSPHDTRCAGQIARCGWYCYVGLDSGCLSERIINPYSLGHLRGKSARVLNGGRRRRQYHAVHTRVEEGRVDQKQMNYIGMRIIWGILTNDNIYLTNHKRWPIRQNTISRINWQGAKDRDMEERSTWRDSPLNPHSIRSSFKHLCKRQEWSLFAE